MHGKYIAHFGFGKANTLIDVCALISTIEGNEAAACTTRGEATSTSLEPKKKNEECKIKNPQINNECMEKILLQLNRRSRSTMSAWRRMQDQESADQQ